MSLPPRLEIRESQATTKMTLPHLDTLIAYTVVMLGVSLIVTVLTQIVSASLGLRGTNLLWGIKALLKSIDPELEAHAEALLTHPIISDSLMSRFRGRFQDKPLIGPLVRRWTLATAIRAGEVVRMLATHAQKLRIAGGDVNVAAAARIEAALGAQTAQQVFGSVEEHFNSAMDRVSQRFAVEMRGWTVIFSFLLALGVQLDTFRLLERLWTDPQTRESLVGTRAAMMQEADAIIQTSSGGAQMAGPGVTPQVYADTFSRIAMEHPKETSGMGDMPRMASYEAARMWLATNLLENEKRINVPDSNNAAILQDYAKSVPAALAAKANAIRQQIETSGLELIPKPFRLAHFDDARNVLGTLVSAVLLSLGAPFWFNALKSLANLRPILANKQDVGA
jgi:hypothetical protein